jgi:LEA14-like dessication related protein
MPFMSAPAKFFSCFIVFLAIPILLTGCTFFNLNAAQPSVVSLTDLKLQEIKAMETLFMLELRISNPDDSPMKIRSLNYALKIDGVLFAAGISDQQLEIAALGSAPLQILLYASGFEQVSSVIQFLQGGDQQGNRVLQYALSGTIHLDKMLWGKKIPFQTDGKLAPVNSSSSDGR